MNKKLKSNKWHHARNSEQMDCTNEPKADLIVTLYGQTKNLDE